MGSLIAFSDARRDWSWDKLKIKSFHFVHTFGERKSRILVIQREGFQKQSASRSVKFN